MSMLPIRFIRLHPHAKAPTYATDGSGGFDLYAATVSDCTHVGATVRPGVPVTCGTGIAVEVPAGHGMFILSRSGHGFTHAVRLGNCVGLIDSDYRGEVKVQLTADQTETERPPLFVQPGDRIAQAVILLLPHVEFVEAESLSETARGVGGFGSTG